MRIVKPYVRLIRPSDFNAPEEFLTYCARISTRTTDKLATKDPKQFIKSIYRKKHLSVLEHYWHIFQIDTTDNYNFYLSLLEFFNRYDIVPNITFGPTRNSPGWSIIISINPRIIYELAQKMNPHNKVGQLIYKLADYMGPVISDYLNQDELKSVRGKALPFHITPILHMSELKHKTSYWPRHMFYTFEIRTNRSTHLEHVRHRFRCAYTAESTRYVNYSKNGVELVAPYGDLDVYQLVENEYKKIVESTKDKSKARSILPNATAIKYVFTTNHKQIVENFLPLRSAKNAAEDIRFIAREISKILGDIHANNSSLG